MYRQVYIGRLLFIQCQIVMYMVRICLFVCFSSSVIPFPQTSDHIKSLNWFVSEFLIIYLFQGLFVQWNWYCYLFIKFAFWSRGIYTRTGNGDIDGYCVLSLTFAFRLMAVTCWIFFTEMQYVDCQKLRMHWKGKSYLNLYMVSCSSVHFIKYQKSILKDFCNQF